MTITIILNGLPKKKKKFFNKIYPALRQHFALDIFETQHAAHAEELAFQAGKNNAAIILASGGDGTLHQVVNGILKSENTLPILGLIPLGSANDFASTCFLKSGPQQIVQLLQAMQPKPTDLGKIRCVASNGKETLRYFVNVCSVGMGPEVVKRLASSSQMLGPSFSYFTSILSTFISHRPQEVYCKAPSWEWKGKARVLALANGKAFGDSTYIAPEAEIDDGLLNSFIAGDLPLWKFLLYLQSIKGKKKIKDSMIHYNTTEQVELSSPAFCALEADGELIGRLPASIEIMRGKINFLR